MNKFPAIISDRGGTVRIICPDREEWDTVGGEGSFQNRQFGPDGDDYSMKLAWRGKGGWYWIFLAL